MIGVVLIDAIIAVWMITMQHIIARNTNLVNNLVLVHKSAECDKTDGSFRHRI